MRGAVLLAAGVAFLIVGATMILLFARQAEDPERARRWRLAGALFIAAGAIDLAGYAWPLISAALGGSSD